MQLIRLFCFAFCLITGVVQTACNDKKREAALTVFLNEYDPALKTGRDRAVSAIAEIQTKRGHLEAAKQQYKSDEARARIDFTIRQVDAELDRLKANLAALDAKIELAMVAKDIRSADAGGLRTQESKELSANAGALLKQADELRNLTENEGEVRSSPSEDKKFHAPPPDRASPPSSATPTPANAMPASPTMGHEAIEKEVRLLNAAIATDEANLQRAWIRVNQLTRNLTVPIVKGSRQHVEYMSLERVIEDCESQLPVMKNRRGNLQSQLEDW